MRVKLLSPVIDCDDGLPVAWSIGARSDASLVNSVLEQACVTFKSDEVSVIHSDRGSHYRCEWIAICEGHGLILSVSASRVALLATPPGASSAGANRNFTATWTIRTRA